MTDSRDPFGEWLNRRPAEPLSPRPGTFDRIARSARRRRWTKAAGTAAAVLVMVTGLAGVAGALRGDDWEPASPPTVSEPAQATTATTPGPASPTGSPPASTSPSAGHSPSQQPPENGRCTAAQIDVVVAPSDNAAGHIGLHIVFTNVSGQTCTMYGYPGVSFVTGPSGSQINDPAQRSAAQGPSTVSVPPHGKAHAALLLVNVANYPPDSCKPIQAAGARVYLPDDTTALFASSRQQICTVKGTGVAQIYPVQAGA